MSLVSIPFPLFVAGTTAVATQVNDNNTAIVDYINANCITKDGLKVATGNLSTSDGDPATDDEYSRRAYVVAQDTALKASNTGFKMVSGSGTPTLTNDNVWKEVCVVSSGTAIPVNATNQTLYLTAFCNAELTSGNGPATFSLRVSFSVDGGTTYGATQQVSGFGTGVTAGTDYTGMALTGFHSFVYSGTPQIMKAKLEIVQRASYSSVWTVNSARCRLAISREVPFA